MLNIDFSTIVFQIINFLILAVALYFLLFKAVIKRARDRKAELESIENEIEKNRAASEHLRIKLEQTYSNVDKETEKIIAETREKLQQERKENILTAKQEAKEIINNAKKDAVQAQQQIYDDFQNKLLDTIIEICRLILVQSTPDEVHNALIKQMNGRIWELGRKEMRKVDAIRRSLKNREPTVYLTSAKPLSAEQQALLMRTFSALADRNVQMEVKIDPALGAGIHIRIGDLIVDNSFSAQLNNLRDNVTKELTQRINRK